MPSSALALCLAPPEDSTDNRYSACSRWCLRRQVGLRDRAIILTLTFAGRRRAEVMGMTAASIVVEDRVFYIYRGKGGKTGRRELPEPAYEAIQAWLACSRGSLESMVPGDSLWPDRRSGRGITSGTFYTT